MLESLVKKPSSLLEGTAELLASHFQPLQQLQQIPQFTINIDFFHRAVANPCTM
jgi:hypothetical protein